MGETRLGQGKDNAREYFKNNKEAADALEADIRKNSYKLLSKQSMVAAIAAGRVDISAEDFDDEK